MEQLSGLDAAFIHQDSYRTPMHITAVLVYDTGMDGERKISLHDLRQLASERLSNLPLFRRQLRQVPMGIDTPYWVDATRRDWRLHIREQYRADPGDWWSFQELLADIHGQRMDLSRPLWEMHLIHGLDGVEYLPPHCQALVLKVHHSAIDGISLAAIINALHRQPEQAQDDRSRNNPAPREWELWTRAHLNTLNRQFKFAETVGNLVPGFLRARETRGKFRDLPPVKRGGSRFNRRVRAGRNTGCMLLPISEVIEVKHAVQRVTFNDIALACVSGALRAYLTCHDQLPTRSLAAGVPINLREPGDQEIAGNKIATMIVGLATHVEDPVERLRLVHRYAVAGKKQINALGTGTIMDISDSLTPGVLAEGMKSVARTRRLMDMPVPFHTIVSNVPGPQEKMMLGNAELLVPFGLGPVRDNMGLFHIVSSSPAFMSIAFSACRRLVPDPGFYQECLANSFNALREQAVA
jgi:diacylglycerol O-acyltransferase